MMGQMFLDGLIGCLLDWYESILFFAAKCLTGEICVFSVKDLENTTKTTPIVSV